jgi:hypothetical protein
MGTTYLHAVASLDGYIADERDDVGPLHDWYFKGDGLAPKIMLLARGEGSGRP